LIIGFVTGVIAYLMALFEEWLVGVRITTAQKVLEVSGGS